VVVFGKVKKYDFSFDGNTGNLLSRSNSYRSLSESFGYDTGNLDRLTSVTGPSAQSVSYDPNNKGNISTKSDAGTFTYDPSKKYALKIVSGGLNISNSNQQVIYNAFEKVQSITEGVKSAEFTYNADNQRIRMVVKNNGAVTKTRWYFGGSCEREQVGSTVNQYIWIGGDAYSAVAVAKKVNTGSFTVYNIFRDHLGTITHLRNSSTGQVDEFSFDAWGRRRDKDNWGYTVSGDPVLFADRGFTAHEFLPDFNLYNMNGRLYDPVVGRFLSPDPYISDPSFSQSYNRYSYCLNNPLKYIDPTGLTWWSDFWDWAGKGLNNLGNWMAKNNIYFYGGVNMSGSGTIPFVGIAGPNNFNVNSQSFVKQPAAPVQRINSQIAGFRGMDREIIPKLTMPTPQMSAPPIIATLEGSDPIPAWVGWVNNGVNAVAYEAGEIGGSFRLMKSGKVSLHWYKSGWSTGNQYVKTTYNLSKFGTYSGYGTSLLGFAFGTYDFAVSDKSWGDYGQLGISFLSSGLTVCPATTPVGIGIGVIDLAGGFNGFYQGLDLNQQLYNSTGFIYFPGYNGIPSLVKLKQR